METFPFYCVQHSWRHGPGGKRQWWRQDVHEQGHYLFPVAVSLGRLVVLDELVVHELECEGRLPHPAGPHHDHLVEGGRRRRLLGHDAGDGQERALCL